ncbi:MAG: hypothetical protein H6924_03320 [Alphaproteobacteria bacterium]|nr:hypothetical protein [Alphaproteobacteria bacterium]
MDLVERLPGWLRWILVPFACALALVLVHMAVRLFFWFQARMMGLGEGAWLEIITDTVIVGGLTGYATVRIGSLVAPSNQKVVSLVIGGVVVMLAGISLFGLAIKHEWRGVVDVLATVIGIGVAIYQVFEEEESKRKWSSPEHSN